MVGYSYARNSRSRLRPPREVETSTPAGAAQGLPADQPDVHPQQMQHRSSMKIRDMVEALRDEKGIKKNTEFLKKEMQKADKKAEPEAPAEK